MSKMSEFHRKLRYEVINFFLENSKPPTVDDLAVTTSSNNATINDGLQALADQHHIKLYEPKVPSLSPITMAHPFSHLPSPYVVTSGNKSWWANCAWCALGLASMLGAEPVTVHILTASGECIRIPFLNGEMVPDKSHDDMRVVFSAVPSDYWLDVRFACSGIQVCTSRSEAESWHENHGFPRGDIITLQQLWELSRAWYHDKATYEYTRMNEAQKDDLFKRIGLVSPYWKA